MKRTAQLIENQKGKWVVITTITCEVIGEMQDRRKVWEEIEAPKERANDQYFLIKINNKYYFVNC